MKRWLVAIPALALGFVLALGPCSVRAQDESAPESSQGQGISVVPDLSAAMPLEQIGGLQSQVVAGLGMHLDNLLPATQARGLSVEPKAVYAYLAQNVKAQAPRSLSGSLLVESLADVSVARRAAASLSSRPEHREVARRLSSLAETLHQDAAGWKTKLQRLQVLRRQTFSSAGNSSATTAYLLDLFDGAGRDAPRWAPQAAAGASSQVPAVSGGAKPRAAFKLDISPAAGRDFRRVPQGDQDVIAPRIAALEQEPRPYGVKKLAGQDSLYRIRVGHWRVIYRIDDKTGAVIILNVLRRSKDTYSAL